MEREEELLAVIHQVAKAIEDLNKTLIEIKDSSFGSSQALHKIGDRLEEISPYIGIESPGNPG